MEKKLLNNQDYELISQLSLVAKRRVTGLVPGEQNSPIQGGGIEFADYREYQAGDDIRRVDWSVFLRFRQLLVKLCAEEKELTLLLMLDTSRSMQFGNPNKLRLAKRIAAILAGIALHGGNRIGIVTLGQKLKELLPPGRNRVSLGEVVNVLEQIGPMENINPSACLSRFSSQYGRKCMAIIITDLLFSEWDRIITGLAASGSESHIIQILAPEELEPTYLGEVTLVDLEGLGEIPIHVDYPVIKQYHKVLDGFLKHVRQICQREGIGYSKIVSDLPLAQILHRELKKGGLLC